MRDTQVKRYSKYWSQGEGSQITIHEEVTKETILFKLVSFRES